VRRQYVGVLFHNNRNADVKWKSNTAVIKPELKNIIPMQSNSNPGMDANIQLPNLNKSKHCLKQKSPNKQSIKNRRNLSIKQSWDRANIVNKNSIFVENFTAKTSGFSTSKHQKIKARNNIETNLKFQPNIEEPVSPGQNVLETVESVERDAVNERSDYYGPYAKVAE
jgi:hypothetical protein